MYEADGTKLPPKEHWAFAPVSVNLPLNTGHLQVAVEPPSSSVQGAVMHPANGAFEQVVVGDWRFKAFTNVSCVEGSYVEITFAPGMRAPPGRYWQTGAVLVPVQVLVPELFAKQA
jgi:hypothetical protein